MIVTYHRFPPVGAVMNRTFKKPRDPVGCEAARTDRERRKAYCFCPLVRNHMDQDMPVTVEIEQSVLRGDDRCGFAVRLPDDL